jgi:hypothetical protein
MPGPRPYYQPEFSAQQIKECQAIITKRSLPHAIVERARLALMLREDRVISNPAAARLLGHHENWVRYWRKRWATEGFGLRDKGGQGRKPLFSPQADDSH